MIDNLGWDRLDLNSDGINEKFDEDWNSWIDEGAQHASLLDTLRVLT